MKRIMLSAVLGLAVASCAGTTSSDAGDAATARAQLVALADNPQSATFEGLDVTPGEDDDAICGRLVDSGVPNSPVRFLQEPVWKRVLLDPVSARPLTGAEDAMESCEDLRRDRSASYESIVAVCRPAEVMRREALLREAFEDRFDDLCD